MIQKKRYQILNKIKSLSDFKKTSFDKYSILAEEIRDLLIKTVAKNGGHLASNLGVVELTMALHKVYDSPKDKIIWDVGHQAYTHKILTGRLDKFPSLRQKDGLSGYLSRKESPHDIFGGGHIGTAVSAALGFAEARDLSGKSGDVIAVIGDGTLTNGLNFEGINNIGEENSNITIVLNDNKWSISKNIGGIIKYLERLSAIRVKGEKRTDIESIFHALGFRYFGPVDGHNLDQLVKTFELARSISGPKLIHVVTKKGMGYEHSELHPDKYHSTSPFILESGHVEKKSKTPTYTEVFSKTMLKMARSNEKLIGITAAMPAGTGLEEFAKKYPDRFYDTGIAESHAVIFSGALALEGYRPVVAIYSSFMQRAYDQLIHDISLQKIPVIFALDRSGIVGSDGPTHHGLFDLSYLRTVPNLVLLAPKDENELQHMLYTAVNYTSGPIAIRYPRGVGRGAKLDKTLQTIKLGLAEKLTEGDDLAILAVGSMVDKAIRAAERLKKDGYSVLLYNARSIKPIDSEMILAAAKTGNIITVEENILEGGFGSAVLEEIEKLGSQKVAISRIGAGDFVAHGEISEMQLASGLTDENIYNKSIKLLTRNQNG